MMCYQNDVTEKEFKAYRVLIIFKFWAFIFAAMNKDSLEDISTLDYVMFVALFSLAITVAVSSFINIILCFKLKRQNQELK